MSVPFRPALIALALTASLVIAPGAAAEAAPKTPAKATKVRHTTTTSTVTIRWKKPKRAKRVVVCLKTRPKAKRCVRSKKTRGTKVTFRKLTPRKGADYVYRITSVRGKRKAVTSWRKVHLKVARGKANQAVEGGAGVLRYSWKPSAGAMKYQIQVSTNKKFTAGTTRNLRRKGTKAKVTGLNGGMTYYSRVRGVNGKVKGKWGPKSRTTLSARPTRATVMTYNLCGENKCRTSTSGAWFLRNVPAWKTRKPLAGSLVRTADPDIIATQESATSTAFHTELPGYSRGAYKAARQIYFKSSRYTAVDGGWMTLNASTKRYATWNLLRDRATGTAFFVVNAHLEPRKGAERDVLRNKQMKKLIKRIGELNAHGLPVVWAGDWNSNADNANQSKYPGGFDAPLRRFTAIGVQNTVTLTDDLTNERLNSANGGVKAPKAHGHHVDGIWVDPTRVAVESWSMLADFVEIDGELQYATPFPSDHNPIAARLVIATN